MIRINFLVSFAYILAKSDIFVTNFECEIERGATVKKFHYKNTTQTEHNH